MKRILTILVTLLFASSAWAGNPETLMAVGLPAQTASTVDTLYGTGLTASTIPATTNAIDLGSLSKIFRKLFIGTQLNASYEVVAGAGTTVADAGALSASKIVHQITGANGTVGWKFATTAAGSVGQVMILLNTTAGVPKIYAASGGTCNGGAADAACTLVTGIVAHVCIATGADTWICA